VLRKEQNVISIELFVLSLEHFGFTHNIFVLSAKQSTQLPGDFVLWIEQFLSTRTEKGRR
jgi:membrane-bound metal-dependent hydrolase YbcI (DUF457 family)